MKFYYAILLLVFLGVITSSAAFDANSITQENSTVLAVGQRLDDPIPAPIEKGSIRVRLKQITNNLTAPNWAVSLPNDPEHLYISDQNGKLWRTNLANGNSAIFLDLADVLVPLGVFGNDSFDERGLLGFAFHPQFAENGLLYTYTSEPSGENSDFSTIPAGSSPNHRSVVREWRVNPTNFPAVVEQERIILTVDQPQFNHNAGALNFGPDNLLYIAFGDGGGADDRDGQMFIGNPIIGHGTDGNGQNLSNPLGSLLRIDPTGSNSSNGKYGIPSDNPFASTSSALPETFAYGFRNPFRFSFDSQTGALILADVGQNDIEEVNLVQSGGNYGWRLKEGSFRFEPNGNEAGFVTDGSIEGNFIDPVVQYDHDEGTAIVGGFVYRGNAIPALQGKYLFGDVAKTSNGDGRLFYSDGGEILELNLADRDQPGFWVLGFGQDGDGELYALGNTTGIPFGTTGAVYKLIPNASFDGSSLEIPAINVTLAGVSSVFHARLRHIPDSEPMRFELVNHEPLADRFRDDSTTFDQTTGKLSLPFTNIVEANGQIFTYSAELQQVPGLEALTFELKQHALVK